MTYAPTPNIGPTQTKYADRNPIARFAIGRFFRTLESLLADIRYGTALDAGCGEGEVMQRLVNWTDASLTGFVDEIKSGIGENPRKRLTSRLNRKLCGTRLGLEPNTERLAYGDAVQRNCNVLRIHRGCRFIVILVSWLDRRLWTHQEGDHETTAHLSHRCMVLCCPT